MTTIHFQGIEPCFPEIGTGFYRATVDGVAFHAGITNAAWAHLASTDALEEQDVSHPAHRVAQGLIQEKFDATGCDRSGSVVVTLIDVLPRD